MTSNKVVLAYLKSKSAMDFTNLAPVLQPGKPLNDRELIRAIRIAIAAEEDAAHFYETVADSTKNSDAKKIFQDTANEEKVHIGEFQKLITMLDKDETEHLEEGAKEVEEKTAK